MLPKKDNLTHFLNTYPRTLFEFLLNINLNFNVNKVILCSRDT